MDWTPSLVDRQAWEQTAERLRAGEASLLSLWGEPGSAYMALLDATSAARVLRLPCEGGRFPSVGRLHAPAIRLERAMHDLAGLEAEGAPDRRPWLHHRAPYPFLSAEGEGTRLRVVESGFRELEGSEEEKAKYAGENERGWEHELGELREYASTQMRPSTRQ